MSFYLRLLETSGGKALLNSLRKIFLRITKQPHCLPLGGQCVMNTLGEGDQLLGLPLQLSSLGIPDKAQTKRGRRR